MSINSPPYPADDVGYCPTITVAQTIVQHAYAVDGPTAIAEIADAVAIEKVGDREQLSIPIGIGVPALRRRIAKVWNGMSDRAKAEFFRDQYDDAARYLRQCLNNIRNELGHIDVEVSLPTSDHLLAKWLS